jgi:hypothetical protein
MSNARYSLSPSCSKEHYILRRTGSRWSLEEESQWYFLSRPNETNGYLRFYRQFFYALSEATTYIEAAAHAFPSSIERLEYNNSHATELISGSQVPVVLFIQ